jgi:phosphate/sulfate permease
MRRPLLWLTCILACVFVWQAGGLTEARAQGGVSTSDRKKYDELMKSARESHSVGVLAIQAGAIILGLGLLYYAWSTATRGFEVTKGKPVKGPVANVIAAVLVLLAVALMVLGIVYAPSLGP